MITPRESVLGVSLTSPFFDGLAARQIRSILEAATPRRFMANSVLFNQGEPVHSAYLLMEGRARHFYITPEGRKIVFTLIMPGDLFGSAALIRSLSSHLVSVEVLHNSRVLVWDKNTIRNLSARYPRLLDNGLSIVGGYVDWLVAAHIGLACHSAELRLAQALVNLAREVGSKGPRGIKLAVTNEELANAANITPFTVSRLMRRWRRAGLLTKGRGMALLHSPEALFRRTL